eukprot:g4511.t1
MFAMGLTLSALALVQDSPRISVQQLRAWRAFYDATDGDSWRFCRDSFDDPCVCDNGRRRVRCDEFGWITHVHLFDNNLRGTLPGAALMQFKRLRELYLYENQLRGTLPGELGRLRKLTRLSLSSNRLTGELPETLADSTTLTSLWLANNRFSGYVPPELAQMKALDHVNLMANPLKGKAEARDMLGAVLHI